MKSPSLEKHAPPQSIQHPSEQQPHSTAAPQAAVQRTMAPLNCDQSSSASSSTPTAGVEASASTPTQSSLFNNNNNNNGDDEEDGGDTIQDSLLKSKTTTTTTTTVSTIIDDAGHNNINTTVTTSQHLHNGVEQATPPPVSPGSTTTDASNTNSNTDSDVSNGQGMEVEQTGGVSAVSAPNTNFTHSFLKSILTSIDSKDPVAANAWLETLLDVIDLLPKDVIKDEVLPVAVAKSQDQSVSAKLTACKLVGKLSTKFEASVLRQDLCGAVQCLCQDVSADVRAGVCEVLATVAIGLGLETTRTVILPELLDLCSDDNITVRIAALHALVDMLSILDSDTRKETIVPLVKKISERSLKAQDACLPLTAHLLGPLCHTLQYDLSQDDKDWFLDFYAKVSVLGLSSDNSLKRTDSAQVPDLVCDVRTPVTTTASSASTTPSITASTTSSSSAIEAECREQCAFNFPGMLVFASGVSINAVAVAGSPAGEFLPPPPQHLFSDPDSPCSATSAAVEASSGGVFRESLLPVLVSFVGDTSVPVRVTIAKAFHQICLCVGSEAVLLREPLLKLLHTDSLEVLAALLPSLPIILQLLHTHHGLTPASSKLEMVTVLLRLEERIYQECGGVWRRHADVLHHMARLVTWMPHTLLTSHLVPRMIDRMNTARALPCRVSAARTLLVYLQHLPTQSMQQELAATIVKEFCQSSSCHHRMLFLTVCSLSIELLNHSIFKQYFSTPMISMHADKVPNIRLRLVSLLPMVKASLILPDDKTILQSLETAVGSLLVTETDKDVCTAVTDVIIALETIELKEVMRSSPEGDTAAQHKEGVAVNASSSNNNESRTTSSDSIDRVSDSRPAPAGSETDKQQHKSSVARKRKDKRTPVSDSSTSTPSKYSTTTTTAGDNNNSAVLSRGGTRGSLRRNSGLPCYVGRRLSAVLPPPKVPPDRGTVMRLTALDPSTDEFLVDAGIRIDESTLRSRLPTPHSSNLLSSSSGARNVLLPDYSSNSDASRGQRPISGSRLRAPTTSSRISADPIFPSENTSLLSVSRSTRGSGRNPRPVSTSEETCSTSAPPTTRTKSLSHENLRLPQRSTSPHMLPDPNDIAADCTPDRNVSTSSRSHGLQQQSFGGSGRVSGRLPSRSSNKPTSCSSSPGASRCTSPGIPAASPPSSRCSSPGGTSRMSCRIGGGTLSTTIGGYSTGSGGAPQHHLSSNHASIDLMSPTTPPSPAPQVRRLVGTSPPSLSPSSSSGSGTTRRNCSRLPLPTHRHR